MAQIIIDIPDAQVAEALDLLAWSTGWVAGNGVTKAQNAKREMARLAKEHLHNLQQRRAAAQASVTTIDVT